MKQVKIYESKQTEGMVGKYIGQKEVDGKVRHILEIEGQQMDIADSTLKRWWQLKEVLLIKPKSYYKQYKRNKYPLWDAVVNKDTGRLELRDGDKNVIVRVYRTDNCFVVRLAQGGKRYFKDIDKVAKHILKEQDIRTNQAIGPVITKWGKQ